MKPFATLLLLASFALAQDKAAEQAVLKAATDLAQAQMKKDRGAMERLLADDIVYSHSNGMRETKAQQIEATLKPTNKYEKIEIKEPSVRVYGNSAVLICKALFAVNNDGKKADNHLSMMQTWVKKGANWQLVARWTTRVQP